MGPRDFRDDDDEETPIHAFGPEAVARRSSVPRVGPDPPAPQTIDEQIDEFTRDLASLSYRIGKLATAARLEVELLRTGGTKGGRRGG